MFHGSYWAEVMNDAKLIADVLHGLVDVDYTLTVNVMKILSVPWHSSRRRNAKEVCFRVLSLYRGGASGKHRKRTLDLEADVELTQLTQHCRILQTFVLHLPHGRLFTLKIT